MSQDKNRSKLLLLFSLISFGARSGLASAASGIDKKTALRASEVLKALNDEKTHSAVVGILQRQGLTLDQIRELSNTAKYFDCEVLLSSHITSKGRASQKSQAKLYNELLTYTQGDNKLNAIYVEVSRLQGASAPAVRSHYTGKSPATLNIAANGLFSSTMSGVDRNTVFESFRLAAINDTKLDYPAIEPGTIINIDRATYGGMFRGKRLSLNVRIQFPGAKAIPYSLKMTFPELNSDETPEEMVVVALMSLSASKHLLENPENHLKTEMVAVSNVAVRIQMARTLDRVFRHFHNGELQKVLDVLGNGRGGSRDDRMARLIVGRKRLSDFMSRAAQNTSHRELTVVPRTNVFRSASNQSPSLMTMTAPPRSGSTSSRSSNSESDYYSYYWGYDPVMGYYYPWVYYPGYSYNPFWAPWYYSQLLSSQDAQPRNSDYSVQMQPDNNLSVQTPLVYQNDQGQVIAMDPNISGSADQQKLQTDGYQPITAPAIYDASASSSRGDDFSSASSGSAPVTDDGRRTASIQVQDTAIVTTTGDSSTTNNSGGSGLFGGGWFTTPNTDTTPTTTTTTTGDVTTTTTTTGVDYTTTTTTTTTGDYTTTTTTTGDSTTTTTGDYTTTTGGGDF